MDGGLVNCLSKSGSLSWDNGLRNNDKQGEVGADSEGNFIGWLVSADIYTLLPRSNGPSNVVESC